MLEKVIYENEEEKYQKLNQLIQEAKHIVFFG